MIDRAERDPERAARGVDVVVLAVPVQAIAPVLGALAPALPPDAVITDAGSVKAPVVTAVERLLGSASGRFCGAIRSPGPSIPGRRPRAPTCCAVSAAC